MSTGTTLRLLPGHKHADKIGTHDGTEYPNLIRVRIDDSLTTIAFPDQVEAVSLRRAA